jgi:hypothetical protein
LRVQIVILTIFNCLLVQAQTDSISNASLHTDIEFSYLSTLIYPGIRTGIEFPVPLVKPNEIVKIKEHKKNKTIKKEHFVSANLNWYHHPDFHDNVYITAEWVMRRTRNTGFISEFSCGPGFSRTFLGGTTYRVTDQGDISVEKLAGYNYALITAGGGIGIDLSMKKQIPFLAIAKMNLISMFPYNSTIYFRPVLEFGIRYILRHDSNRLIKN